jgi:phospholipid/cholesterol/gamma-HCH transport system substrate-binding protein
VTYPFPDSSLTALNYREAQTGGYALFTNMTATVNLDLTELLCRYGIDNVGALVEVDPTTIGPEQCGVPGPDDEGTDGGTDGGGSPLDVLTSFGVPGLSGLDVTQLPDSDDAGGLLGFPSVGGLP